MPLPIKFNPKTSNVLNDRDLVNKIKSAKKSTPKSNNIMDVIERIRQDVENNLGQFKDQYQVITDFEEFRQYIHKANAFGKIAIDTETLGLNPLVDGIVGICLYFPGEPATYVPINHSNYLSDIRIDGQLTEQEAFLALSELTADIIYHNAQFDIRVLKNQVGIRLPVYWDTLLAGHLYDENELHGLKYLHYKYIEKAKAALNGINLDESDNEKTFSDLFGKLPFKYVPIEYAYLYAAHDAIDTYELYEFQYNFIKNEPELLSLMFNIEVPMVDVIVDLEDAGVAVDTEYLQQLHDKYTDKVNDAYNRCCQIIDQPEMQDKILKYNAIHSDKPFMVPPNINSSQQLGILFYDLLKCNKIHGKKDRCTDADAMDIWSKKYPIAKAILDYRAATKITSTYVDNIPEIIHTDGRVHTHFNSMGAKTGRMSSANPLNLQNIPSHNEDIRKMFVGQTTIREVGLREDNAYIFNRCEEIQLQDGTWQWVELIKPNDILITGDCVKVVKIKDTRVLIGI